MPLRGVRPILLGAVLACAVGVGGASAQLTTFAEYTSPGQVYLFNNTGSSSTFGVTGSVDVNFVYDVANGYGPKNVAIPALMTFTSQVNAPATTQDLGGGDTLITQIMQNIVFTFTAKTPVDGKTNLLTATANLGRIQGTDIDNSASFSSDTQRPGRVITYTSDFLTNFGNTRKNLIVGLTSLLPDFRLDNNGYLATFQAAGPGSFASDPAPLSTVPEPGMLSVGGATLVGLALAFRKRRK